MTPRYLAVQALLHQEQNGYANLVLDGELRRCKPPLEARDAAFSTRIFYTVLERQRLLDFCIDRFSKKPVAKLDAPVRAILRAGLAQAKFLQVPVPAAVNESVKLAKAFGKTSAAGMVNAVLRRAAAYAPQPADFAADIERLAVLQSLSGPIAALLLEQYGAAAFPLAEAFYSRQPVMLRVNSLKTTDAALIAALAAEGCKAEAGPWPHSLRAEFSGSPAATKAFAAGLYHVQGLSSQLAALCVEAKPGMRVLDLCAAPGGKSLTLAEAMENRGTLLSCDAVAGRVPLIEKAFVRCGITCGTARRNDATIEDPQFGLFDRILCDVPCSGLGVIGKKPDIRYKTLENIEELYQIQAHILENAAGHLAPGGRLVYSTCTVNRLENEAQIERFLQKHTEFRLAAPAIRPQGAQSGEHGMLLLPQLTGTDGFFVAVLEQA